MNRFCLLLVFMMIFWGNGEVVYSGTIEEDVTSALAEISSEKDIAKAIRKTDQARQLLSSGAGQLDSILGNILEADIALTMGKRYAAELKMNPENLQYRHEARLLLEWAAESYGRVEDYSRKMIEDAAEKEYQDNSIDRVEIFRDYFARSVNSQGWCYYYLAKINDQTEPREELLQKARKKFEVSLANNEKNKDLELDGYAGLATCLMEREKYFTASGLLDSLQFDPEEISSDTFRRITYLMVKSSAEIKSNIDIENYAKRYMDSLSDAYDYNETDNYIASSRLKALARLSRKNGDNPYYQSYLRRFKEECDKAFSRGNEIAVTAALIMQKLGMDIGQENKIKFELARVSVMIGNRSYDKAKKSLGEIDLESIKSANRLQRAAKLWNSLSSGYRNGTEEWIECNYKRIECYMLDGKQKKADRLVEDIIAEHGEQIPQIWIDRFKIIVREAGS